MREGWDLGRGVSLVFRLKASSNGCHPLFTTHRVMQNEPRVRSETPTTRLWGRARSPTVSDDCRAVPVRMVFGRAFRYKNVKGWELGGEEWLIFILKICRFRQNSNRGGNKHRRPEIWCGSGHQGVVRLFCSAHKEGLWVSFLLRKIQRIGVWRRGMASFAP